MTSTDAPSGEFAIYDTQELQQDAEIASADHALVFVVRVAGDDSLSMPFGIPDIDDLLGISEALLQRMIKGLDDPAGFIVPEGKGELQLSLYEAAKSLTPWRKEFRIRHPRKGERWIDANARPHLEPDGAVLWLGSIQDITDRKIMDEALHYNTELLFAQQEASIDGILAVNADFSISSMNSQFAKMWGLPKELVDRKDHKAILEFSAPQFADPAMFSKGVKNLYSDPAGRSRHELPLKDGRIIERLSAPLYGSDGQSRGRLWTFRDITGARQIQQALLESERFARSTSDSLSAHIAILDCDGKILATNQSWNRYANENNASTTEVLQGANYLTVCDNTTGTQQLEAESFAKGIREVLAGSKSEYSLEYPCHSPTEKRWFVGRVTRFVGDGPTRLVIAHENITERVVALNQVLESKALLSEMERTAKIGGWQIDLHTGMKTWTDEVARIHCVDLNVPISVEKAMQYYLPESRAVMVEALRLAREHRTAFNLELELMAADGTHKWVRAIGHAETEGARVVRITGSIQDITEKRKNEAALKALQETLVHAQKMEAVGQLAGGIAHDFNNLLQIINAYSKRITDDYADDPVLSRYGKSINQAGEIAADLTRQLLAFSRKTPAEPRMIELDEVIAGMEDMIRGLLSEGISLQLDLDSPGKFIVVDPGQIEQIVMNLLVNARDAMPNGGSVKVSTYAESRATSSDALTPMGFVGLSIADSGQGMDYETQKRVFEPFFTTKQLGRGTGLGLSTVYGIVQQCGAQIEMESQLGVGTEFRFSFPQVETPSMQEAAVKNANSEHGTERILIVEDDPDLRELYRDVLDELGYRVSIAENGQEALDLIVVRSQIFDLVISDTMMPIMGGIELLESLKTSRPQLKLLLMSGNVGDRLSNSELEGQVELLAKPFSIDAFSAKVRELLGSASTQRYWCRSDNLSLSSDL